MLLSPFVGLSDSRITEKVRKNFSEIWEVFKDTIDWCWECLVPGFSTLSNRKSKARVMAGGISLQCFSPSINGIKA